MMLTFSMTSLMLKLTNEAPVRCFILSNVIPLYYNLYHFTYQMSEFFKHSLNNSQ